MKTFIIKSSSGAKTYTVTMLENEKFKCTCPAFRYYTSCKHINNIQQEQGLPVPVAERGLGRPAANTPFIQMKLKYYSAKAVKKPKEWLMATKYDGFFVRWDSDQGKLLTSTGRPLNPPDSFLANMPKTHNLDAELYAGKKNRASKLNPLVNDDSQSTELWKDVQIIAFDIPIENIPFVERWDMLQKSSHKYGYKIVAYKPVESRANLFTQLDRLADNGDEGIVLKHMDNLYKGAKRSSTSLKLKPERLTTGTISKMEERKKGYKVAVVRETVLKHEFKVTLPPNAPDYQVGQTIRVKYRDRDEKNRPMYTSLA
jgi:ATP-dependent DNA ligase